MSDARNFLSDAELEQMFQKLLSFRTLTNPKQGQESAQEKNLRAQLAIFLAGVLIDNLVGWAGHHIIGTRFEKLGSENRKSGKADSHHYELLGREFKPDDPKLDREIIAFLVVSGSYVPQCFRNDLRSGLQALNNGEQTPLMTPSSAGEWRKPYSLSDIRLRAILHLFYLWGRGVTKKKATETIANTFNTSPHTVRGWERKYVPEKRGEVENVYDIAKRAGKIGVMIENGEELEEPIDRIAIALHRELSSEDIDDLAQRHIDCLKST